MHEIAQNHEPVRARFGEQSVDMLTAMFSPTGNLDAVFVSQRLLDPGVKIREDERPFSIEIRECSRFVWNWLDERHQMGFSTPSCGS